jgi:signal transduction histidine kinase
MEPLIEGNPDMLRQIFLSLILIALQSLPLSSRLDIETTHIQKPPLIEIHFRAAGREFLDRVSGTNENAGMGLAIIHHIMSMHHGSVRIEQSNSEHTAFILSFPLTADINIDPFEGKP